MAANVTNVKEDYFDKIVTNKIVKTGRRISVQNGNMVYGAKNIDLGTKLSHRWEFKVQCQRTGSICIGLVERSGSFGAVADSDAKGYLFKCPATNNADDAKQQDTIIMTLDCASSTLTYNRNGQDESAMDVAGTSCGFKMCVSINMVEPTSNSQMIDLSSYSEKEKVAKCHGKGWTTEDEHFLWSNKTKLSMKEIAEKLNRSESACDQKLKKLKNKWKDRWCEQCDKLFDTEKGLKLHNGKTHSSRKKAKKSHPEPDSTTLPPKHHKLVWSAKEVAQWLISLGSDYREYAPKFVSAGINGLLLNAMDGTDLQEIVASKLHRSIIMNAWSANRNEQVKKKKSKKKNKYKDSGVE